MASTAVIDSADVSSDTSTDLRLALLRIRETGGSPSIPVVAIGGGKSSAGAGVFESIFVLRFQNIQ
jgi:hypothetical protein